MSCAAPTSTRVVWGLGIGVPKKPCENPEMKVLKKQAACVYVFSYSEINNDKLKDIQTLREGFFRIYVSSSGAMIRGGLASIR